MDFVLSDGKKCELITKCSKGDKNYIIYTDGTKDEFGENLIFASRYEIKDGEYILLDIETDQEWDYIDEELAKLGDK